MDHYRNSTDNSDNNDESVKNHTTMLPMKQHWSGISSPKVIEKVTRFLNRTGCDLVQSNGQRHYGPPPHLKGCPVPSRGSEVFVGKLPRDFFEDELVPLFERVGPVYETRLMMDFNGLNRGYAFVKYTKPQDANRAVLILDNFEVRSNKRIGVSKSVDNCRLFVGGIPLTCTAEQVADELNQVVEGLVQVIMYPSMGDVTKNRGFVFIEFESHRLAAMARKKLNPGGFTMWGHPLIIDWAEPEPEVDPRVMMKIRKLYLRNLSLSTTEDAIRNFLEQFIAPTNVLRIKKIKNFAFVHFKTRTCAEVVLKRANGLTLDESVIEMQWARPPMYSKDRISLPAKLALCMSLPPRLRSFTRNMRLTPHTLNNNEMFVCARQQERKYYSSESGTHSNSIPEDNIPIQTATQIPQPAISQAQPIYIPYGGTAPQPQPIYPHVNMHAPNRERPIYTIPYGPGPQQQAPVYYQFVDRSYGLH